MTAETNRDLFLDVMAAVRARGATGRSLLDFLVALRHALMEHREAPALTSGEFVSAITAGFVAGVPPVDADAWRSEDLDAEDESGTFDDLDRMLRSQILDLLDAREAGTDRDEERYFGVDIPRRGPDRRATGPRWFNWDPAGFVECGMVGSFGGWEPEDEGGRELIGDAVGVDAQRPLSEITWSNVVDFLWAGQNYE